nr:MAG TPA_asm: hypothetical protein [Caudoviricetes sp.]
MRNFAKFASDKTTSFLGHNDILYNSGEPEQKFFLPPLGR